VPTGPASISAHENGYVGPSARTRVVISSVQSAIATKWAGSGSPATWTPRLLPKLLPNHLTRAGNAVDTRH